MSAAAGCGGSTDVIGPGAGGSAGVTTSISTTTGGGPAVSCGKALTAGVMHESIAFGGQMRVYDVQVPASYVKNAIYAPLVFDLHGLLSNKEQQEALSGFSKVADKEGFVVVRVDGYQNSWNGGDYCCGQAKAMGLDDVGLMKAIAVKVEAELCIDAKRVYATGLSNGGALSHRIACDGADVFAMTAPVSYPLDFNPMTKCKPARPISVMHFHGLIDPLVPYKGGAISAPVVDSFHYWAKANGCSGDPAVALQKGASHCDTYKQCNGGATVTLCSLDGGHVLYTNNDEVPIAELAWAEMRLHSLP